MDWVMRMNRALDYIESNLTGKIELKEVAKCACCSSHQFQRMFSFITDVSLAEYIRRRRLEKIFQLKGVDTPAELWRQSHANGEVERLAENAGDLPTYLNQDYHKIHAVCSYKQTDEDHFPYMLSAFKGDSSKSGGTQILPYQLKHGKFFPLIRSHGTNLMKPLRNYINGSSPNGFLLLDTNRSMGWNLKLLEAKTGLTSLSCGLQ